MTVTQQVSKPLSEGIDMLLEEGMNIKVCLLPDGDDPTLLPANIIQGVSDIHP